MIAFKNAHIGPISDYKQSKQPEPDGSFYSRKFCLLWTDKALQQQLWRAENSRRKVQDASARETMTVHMITKQFDFKAFEAEMIKPHNTQGD